VIAFDNVVGWPHRPRGTLLGGSGASMWQETAALRDFGPANDRLGSITSICDAPVHVRFTFDSDPIADMVDVPFRANSGLMQCSNDADGVTDG
jgi:hypothetical protein